MKEIIFSWFTNLGQKLAVLLLVGTTAVTTGSAVTKIAARNNVLGVSSGAEVRIGTGGASISPTPTVINPIVKPTANPTAKPTTRPLPTATPAGQVSQVVNATPDLSGRCIITLSGKQYDVTTLRSSHSGGDVFVCDSDMTASYQAKHGTNMNRMARYEVTAGGQTGVTGGGTTGTDVAGVGSADEEEDEEEDEREDAEHEERYVEDQDERSEDED
jgi:hypothetical protein